MASKESVQKIRLLKKMWSLALCGGYTVSVCYRIGALRTVLPAHLYAAIEHGVNTVKHHTKPLGLRDANMKRFTLSRRSLARLYGWASSSTMTMAAASGLLRACKQYMPKVALFAVACCISSTLLLIPKLS